MTAALCGVPAEVFPPQGEYRALLARGERTNQLTESSNRHGQLLVLDYREGWHLVRVDVDSCVSAPWTGGFESGEGATREGSIARRQRTPSDAPEGAGEEAAYGRSSVRTHHHHEDDGDTVLVGRVTVLPHADRYKPIHPPPGVLPNAAPPGEVLPGRRGQYADNAGDHASPTLLARPVIQAAL